MYCRNCGKEINYGAKFCPICGAGQESVVSGIEQPQVQSVLHSQQEERAAPQAVIAKKNGNRAVILTAVIAAICVFVFLFYIGPKFLGVQYLPFDPFGIMSVEDKNDVDEKSKSDELDDDDTSVDLEIDTLKNSVGDVDRKALEERNRKIVEDGELTMGEWRGEPIRWRVLDVQEDRALLISEDVLTVRQYDGLEDIYGERLADAKIDWAAVKVTWADSEIREWLNSDFMDEVFSESEKESILLTEIINLDNEDYGTNGGINGGDDTNDKVFLLSIDEADRYFSGRDDRIAYFTMTEEDAGYMNRIADEDYSSESDSGSLSINVGGSQAWWWWLRSPGYGSDFASGVHTDGKISGDGGVNYGGGGVRPVFWIDLNV